MAKNWFGEAEIVAENVVQHGTMWHNVAQCGTMWHNVSESDKVWQNARSRGGSFCIKESEEG